MRRILNLPLLLTTFALSALAGTAVHAVQRTHVSAAFGVDTNTATGCTPVAPCRTFQSAMTVTDPNGEVVVLDSGGYGAVRITRSVALIAPAGVYAGISVFPGTDGVDIDAPGVNVVLRGLTINGQGGNNGIAMFAGNSLTVENCVISNLGFNGIIVVGVSTVRVIGTIIRDNGAHGVFLVDGARGTIVHSTFSGHANNGIRAQGTSAGSLTIADIADVTLDGNRGSGVFAFSDNASAVVKVSVRDSRAVRNDLAGIAGNSNVGGTVSVTASNNLVSNNGNGIVASFPGTKVWASGNTISENDTGLRNSGGALFETAGNNAVRNNGNNKSGDINIISAE